MLGFMFFHVYVLGFTCSHTLPCLYVQIYVFTLLGTMLYAIFHVLVCSMPCLCAQAQTCLSCHVLLQPFCSIYRIFLCFGLLVRTLSRPYGLCHRPYTLAHIKGFESPNFSCMCLLASMFYACVSLSCSRLCHICCPQLVCGCMVTFDAHAMATLRILSRVFLFHFEKISGHFGLFRVFRDVSVNTN